MRRTYKPTTSRRATTARASQHVQSFRAADRTQRAVAYRRPAVPAAMYSAPRATELKAVDTVATTYSFNTAGAVAAAPLNVPVSGAAFYQRIGNKIAMKSLQLRGLIIPSNGNAAAVTEQICRVIIYYDRQANGAAPAVSDILLSTTSAGATSSQSYDFVNMNNRDRFLILMDEQVLTPAVGINGATAASTVTQAIDLNGNAGGAEQGQFNINRYIKLKGLEAQYKASAGNIGDIAAGAIGVLTIGISDANATSAWVLNMSSRLRYTDY